MVVVATSICHTFPFLTPLSYTLPSSLFPLTFLNPISFSPLPVHYTHRDSHWKGLSPFLPTSPYVSSSAFTPG